MLRDFFDPREPGTVSSGSPPYVIFAAPFNYAPTENKSGTNPVVMLYVGIT
jgi:hypothetical protein